MNHLDPIRIEKLLSTIVDEDYDKRMHAYGLIMSKPLVELAPRLLLQAQQVELAERRDVVVLVLGFLKYTEALPALLEIFRNDPYPIVKANAAVALGALGDPIAYESLVGQLTNADDLLAERILLSLGKINNPRAFEILVSELNGVRTRRRVAAAMGLGALMDKRAITPLIAVLNTNDLDVTMNVIGALANLGGPDAYQAIIEVRGWLDEVWQSHIDFLLQIHFGNK